MPKVAHFIDSHDPGGAETLVVDISRNVQAYGYSAEVYHCGNSWLEEKCLQYNIPTQYIPGRRFYTKAVTIPLFSMLFRNFLLDRHVDILHSHLFGPVSSACFAAFLAGIPHIGTLHDVYTLEEKRSRMRYLSLASMLKTQLITVSGQMQNYVESMGSFHDGAVQTIVNGVDIEKYGLKEPRSRHAELHLNADDIVFICVGRLEKIKGHSDLIKAFAQLNSLAKVRLLIVGEGTYRKEIERQIDLLGLHGHVRLLGQRDDVPRLLSMADCFVLSSYSEGLSCSIIEAMAAGLPILATDVGGNKELVQDGINGYLIPLDAPNAFAERIQAMIADARLRSRFGKISSLSARSNYSLQTMIEKYISKYNEMISRGRQRPTRQYSI